jgi:hypothetical protein
MENVTTDPRAVRHVVASGALADDPFVLLDVGCALGIDPAWRHFGRYLVAHGFDPQVDECARPNVAETNPNIVYHPAFVGLPEEHPGHAARHPERLRRRIFPTGRPNERVLRGRSESQALTMRQMQSRQPIIGEATPRQREDYDQRFLDPQRTALSRLRQDRHRRGPISKPPFTTSTGMKSQGFLLFGMAVNTHSRAPFQGRSPTQPRIRRAAASRSGATCSTCEMPARRSTRPFGKVRFVSKSC